MIRTALALLLIPSLAFADDARRAELLPRLQAMSTPQLLQEYETIDASRPGYGGPMAIMGVGTASLLFGLAVASVRITSTTNGVTTTSSGASGWVAPAFISLGVAAVLAGGFWLFMDVRKRDRITSDLEVVAAELDARERKAVILQPELLSLLAAPPLVEAPSRTSGGLLVIVTGARGPLPGARVEVNGEAYVSDERGVVTIDGLPVGPVPLAVSAEGHQRAEEAASVVPGKRTPVTLTLRADKERASARLTGMVRSSATGLALQAELLIAETKSRVPVDREGLFKIDVPGGAYTVTIASPGYLTQTKQVKVKPGDRAIFNVDLHPL